MSTKIIVSGPTNSLPEIAFEDSIISIAGICKPENSKDFFDAIKEKIIGYVFATGNCKIIFFLNYFNTSASACLLIFFKQVKNNYNLESNITIYSQYEAEDLELLESGEVFEELSGLTFTFNAL